MKALERSFPREGGVLLRGNDQSESGLTYLNSLWVHLPTVNSNPRYTQDKIKKWKRGSQLTPFLSWILGAMKISERIKCVRRKRNSQVDTRNYPRLASIVLMEDVGYLSWGEIEGQKLTFHKMRKHPPKLWPSDVSILGISAHMDGFWRKSVAGLRSGEEKLRVGINDLDRLWYSPSFIFTTEHLPSFLQLLK